MKVLAQYLLDIFPNAYRRLFQVLFLISRLFLRKEKEYDLLFIVLNKDWILERICIEIKKRFRGNSRLHYSICKIPRAGIYFFPHYQLFISAAIRNPHIFLGDIYIYFTHYREGRIAKEDFGTILNFAKKIFVMNSNDRKLLINFGVKPEKIQVVMAGVNDKVFRPNKLLWSKPEIGTVGFCLRYLSTEGYAPRKNYNLVIDIIKDLKNCNILLIGRDWKNFNRLNEIIHLPNFTYIETEYSNYPVYYNKMNVFVSVSKLEGGPVPLLEAMFCNVFPVVSKTGFAEDIITNNYNGLLFETSAKKEEIIELIHKGLRLSTKANVRSSVKNLTWENFSQTILANFSYGKEGL